MHPKFVTWLLEPSPHATRHEQLEDLVSLIRSNALTPQKRVELIEHWMYKAWLLGQKHDY